MPKKLIRVDGPDTGNNPYISSSLQFSLVSNEGRSATKDGARVCTYITKFISCREYLNRSIRIRAIQEDSDIKVESFDYIETQEEYVLPPDFGALRLLMAMLNGKSDNTEIKDSLFNGKRALNLIEDFMGWDKSVITSVKHVREQSANGGMWLLTGPKEWMATPQMLSLCTWIMRFNVRRGEMDTTSLPALYAWCDRNWEKYAKSYPYIPNRLKSFFIHSPTIFRHYDEIFGPLSVEDAWCIKNHDVYSSDFGSRSGITTFIEGQLPDGMEESKKAQERFSKFYNKYNHTRRDFFKLFAGKRG
jgi:hypothetical protein